MATEHPKHSSIGNEGIYLHKWIVPILLALVLAFGAAWTSMLLQVSNSLPRVEAAVTYVSKADYATDREHLDARLVRIEEKLDKLLEKVE